METPPEPHCNRPPPGIIILAAGASTRLGRPKQLLEFRGRSLLRHAVETALASVCRPVIVVLGASAEQLVQETHGLSAITVTNPHWSEGMASSIRAGLNFLAPEGKGPDAVVLTLCDQPLVSTELLNRLVSVHRSTGKGIVASEYGGQCGVPALFGRTYYPELAALKGDRGAKTLFVKYAAEVESIPFPEAAVDVDRAEDIARLAGCQI
jgi:molybdenum cofactor cytidylyltransferase